MYYNKNMYNIIVIFVIILDTFLKLIFFNFLNNFHCYNYTNAHIFSHKYKCIK